MMGRRIPHGMFLAFVGLLATGSSRTARATYAGMGAAPAGTGELRLTMPRGATGTAARCAGGETGQLVAFPLRRTDVVARVSGVVAAVTVEQTFENCFDEAIEAVYVFPLPDDAAVNAYEIVIGSRTIRGVIREADEARRIYEEARQRGETAAILEQEKANVFQQRIANIARQEAVRVRFSYVQRVSYEDGAYRFVFPMVVGPRFLPSGTSDPNPVGGHWTGGSGTGAVSVPYATERVGHEIAVKLRIEAGLALDAVTSTSHEIDVQRGIPSTVDVSLAPRDRIPNKDLTVDWRPASRENLVASLAHRREADGYFFLVVQPKADWGDAEMTSREVVLLIDRSGSMDGSPLGQSKAVARGILATLRATDTFNVIAFASGLASMRPEPVRATPDAVREGIAFVEGLVAGGGTYMVDGLKGALHRAAGSDQIRMVYMLTDGFVGNDAEVLAAVQRADNANRIFAVGVGSSPNRALLNQVAEAGRGFALYLRQDEDPAPTIVKLNRRTASPAMVDVRFDWHALVVSDLVPRLLPDVFVGQPIAIAGRYREPRTESVDLTARIAGREVTNAVRLELPAETDRPEVSLLWARERIHELMMKDPYERQPDVRREVTALGLKFALVTRYTSFVAVDETRVVDADGQTRTVAQPAILPEGVNGDMALGGQPPPTVSSGGGAYPGGRRGAGAADAVTIVLALAVGLAAARRRRAMAP